ncbi:hypothetical protein AXK57_21850 [Tsukamurella pulmonis]|uniref:N-acetyltransferase n=1 Tax=Tsukamurella pulmonis TaxID=47312 RepID=UPI0007946FFE|nr:N-acetyltransferase [Tsukamurella pulmonis]KXP11588.1 hypothetical protein AXK57_21850 [Tsukamurella pulmonis]
MPVLLEPQTAEHYTARNRQAIKAAIVDDFTVWGIEPQDRDEVARLVREHVPGAESFTRDDAMQQPGVVIKDLAGAIVAGALYTHVSWAGSRVLLVTQVFTLPAYRGRGFARIALGQLATANATAGTPAQFLIGTCTTSTAPFFADSMCTVLSPGTPLPLADLTGRAGNPEIPVPSSAKRACWFYGKLS